MSESELDASHPGVREPVRSAVSETELDTRCRIDRPISEGAINLTQAGLQRHRVLCVREQSKEETRQVGDNRPTIDSIELAEFESHDSSRNGCDKRRLHGNIEDRSSRRAVTTVFPSS
jgi:hypothetical protein